MTAIGGLGIPLQRTNEVRESPIRELTSSFRQKQPHLRSGEEWVQNEIIAKIIQRIAFMGNKVTEGTFKLVEQLFGMTFTQNGVQSELSYNGNKIGFGLQADEMNLNILINGMTVQLSDIFFGLNIETLSIIHTSQHQLES